MDTTLPGISKWDTTHHVRWLERVHDAFGGISKRKQRQRPSTQKNIALSARRDESIAEIRMRTVGTEGTKLRAITSRLSVWRGNVHIRCTL